MLTVVFERLGKQARAWLFLYAEGNGVDMGPVE